MRLEISSSHQKSELARYEQYFMNNGKELERIQKESYRKELMMIESNELMCPYEQLSTTVFTDSDLKKLSKGFDDSNVAKAVTCRNNYLAYSPNQFLRTHLLLKDLKLIGSGSEGNVLMSHKDHFIVKNNKNPEDSDQLVHEYFVGAFGTNTLRNEIPNFSAVLGYFRCSGTFIEDKDVVAYCLSEDEAISYVLYEPIKGPTLDVFIRSCGYQAALQVLTGLILALEVAYRKIDFTHYDLHMGNVIIRILDQEIDIPYNVGGTIKYLHTRFVPVIIDYGRVHIKYNGQDYGYEAVSFGIMPDRSFPMYDIYKVIMYTINTFRHVASQEDANKLLKIVSVFSKDEPNKYLQEAAQNYFIAPYDSNLDISPYQFFENYWYPLYKNDLDSWLTARPRTPAVYGCASNNTCLTLQNAIEKYTTNFKDLLADVLIFYDMVMINPGKSEFISQGERYSKGYYDQITEYKRQIYNSMNFGGNVILSMRSSVAPNKRYKKEFVSQYTSYVRTVVDNFNKSKYFTSYDEIYRFLLEHYPVTENITNLNSDLNDAFNSGVGTLQQHIDSLQEDLDFLDNQVVPETLDPIINFLKANLRVNKTPEASTFSTQYEDASSFSEYESPVSFSSAASPVNSEGTPNLSRFLAQLKL